MLDDKRQRSIDQAKYAVVALLAMPFRKTHTRALVGLPLLDLVDDDHLRAFFFAIASTFPASALTLAALGPGRPFEGEPFVWS